MFGYGLFTLSRHKLRHMDKREELIGKVTNPETDYAAYTARNKNGDDVTDGCQPDSSENSSDCVKSFVLDHSYLSQAVEKAIFVTLHIFISYGQPIEFNVWEVIFL